MNPIRESQHDSYLISTDQSKFQIDAIHNYLCYHSYWSKNIPKDVVKTFVLHSFGIGVYHIESGRQVGFARLVTDYSVFAYLADVYIIDAHQGKGLGKAMMSHLMEEPFVGKLRLLTLLTLDAHDLYRKYGYELQKNPQHAMEIRRPGIYGDVNNPCK